ncbi:uncharacterized protein LOC110021830 [Phalaenopsis equestris]|uniref:uncharacterized protein LOC110021830 n=1 Tax=Phalaenopsis equestris TaxID=78828 RepID=UPI0009E389DC|nr:uncharacterized protein LOC110021830 [Phalaenopsis equestris]
MESAPEIIDISSDEDEDISLRIPEESRAHHCGERRGKDGDCNDLMMPMPEASLDVSDDEDCVILDGAPKSVAADSEFVELGGEILDEMLIVGEKGQFACRDYPHPRYLCATFLFTMTPHKKHCNMCHCYVCDCPAPCTYWASHCSSTHKEQSWRIERLLFRKRKREQQNAHQIFDVKPTFIGLDRPDSKFARSLSPKDEVKSTWRHVATQRSHIKPALIGQIHSISKTSSSLSSNEPPHHPTDTAASRPKDILAAIYQNCPLVISCRRRIPPSCQADESSDTDNDD